MNNILTDDKELDVPPVYELWVRIDNASTTAQPFLSDYVRDQLIEAKALWEKDHRDQDAFEIVGQFFTCDFDTRRLDNQTLFTEMVRQGSSGRVCVQAVDFSNGLIPRITKAVTEVYLLVNNKLSSRQDLEVWQAEHGSLVPGMALKFLNEAWLSLNGGFNDGDGFTEYTIAGGAVEFEPDCQGRG